MKKTKILFGAVLAIILALSCLAFTACDGTFNIDSQENVATDASLAAFMSGVAENAGIDTEAGLPSYIAGNSYSVEYNIVTESEGGLITKTKTKTTVSLNGSVNFTKNMTGKFEAKSVVEESDGENSGTDKTNAAMALVDNKLYIDTTSNKTDTGSSSSKSNKIVMDLGVLADKIGDINIGDYLPEENETVQLDDFIDEIKASLSDFEIFGGVTINPTVYIKDGTMKITLGDVGYVGIKFDNEWKLDAIDMVVEVSGDGAKLNTEIKLRKSGAVSVSAPSDASDYMPIDIGGIIGGITG